MKKGDLGERPSVGGGSPNGEGDESRWIGVKYFPWMYENRTMKPIKVDFKREVRKSVKGVEFFIKIHYMHVWIYHNKTPLYNWYTIINKIHKNK
jgi:hypothetical protein